MNKEMAKEYNVKALAYLGDAVYEVYIRKHIMKHTLEQVAKLHKKAIKYVSAKAQAYLVESLDEFWNQEEKDIIRRGRNADTNTVPKNTDVVTYKVATGFETLIGFLYLTDNIARLEEIIYKAIKTIEEKEEE